MQGGSGWARGRASQSPEALVLCQQPSPAPRTLCPRGHSRPHRTPTAPARGAGPGPPGAPPPRCSGRAAAPGCPRGCPRGSAPAARCTQGLLRWLRRPAAQQSCPALTRRASSPASEGGIRGGLVGGMRTALGVCASLPPLSMSDPLLPIQSPPHLGGHRACGRGGGQSAELELQLGDSGGRRVDQAAKGLVQQLGAAAAGGQGGGQVGGRYRRSCWPPFDRRTFDQQPAARAPYSRRPGWPAGLVVHSLSPLLPWPTHLNSSPSSSSRSQPTQDEPAAQPLSDSSRSIDSRSQNLSGGSDQGASIRLQRDARGRVGARGRCLAVGGRAQTRPSTQPITGRRAGGRRLALCASPPRAATTHDDVHQVWLPQRFRSGREPCRGEGAAVGGGAVWPHPWWRRRPRSRAAAMHDPQPTIGIDSRCAGLTRACSRSIFLCKCVSGLARAVPRAQMMPR